MCPYEQAKRIGLPSPNVPYVAEKLTKQSLRSVLSPYLHKYRAISRTYGCMTLFVMPVCMRVILHLKEPTSHLISSFKRG